MPHTALHIVSRARLRAAARRVLPVLLLFLLVLAAAPPLAAQAEWTGVERVVAVGDVHGDYDGFVEILRSAGVIDEKDRWIGGKTHLVQAGDVPDRGPATRKVMDLLMALEKQAAKAGGHVHALIGNHEAMNMYGDLRYTTPGEFAAFRTGESEQLRANLWEQESRGLASADRKKWEAEHPLGWVEQRTEFGPKGTYGKWIRSHNAVVKINDAIYLHGGISPKYVTKSLNQINEAVAAELSDVTKIKDGSPLTAADGPLWYRGLAQEEGAAIEAHVNHVLAAYGVKRIVIGHTPTAGAVIPRFGGKVVQIDVGLSAAYGSHRACLLEEGDKLYAIHRGEKIPLPGNADILSYLKKVLSLEPAGSLLAKYVAEVEAGLAPAK
ncbi:Metallophosphoesterase [Candidatus Sulfopaludibacter sp. SbA6]|nr:Metallophosphoesterase [Candidatus Sulfopaludibacter sp. SbA6]